MFRQVESSNIICSHNLPPLLRDPVAFDLFRAKSFFIPACLDSLAIPNPILIE